MLKSVICIKEESHNDAAKNWQNKYQSNVIASDATLFSQ